MCTRGDVRHTCIVKTLVKLHAPPRRLIRTHLSFFRSLFLGPRRHERLACCERVPSSLSYIPLCHQRPKKRRSPMLARASTVGKSVQQCLYEYHHAERVSYRSPLCTLDTPPAAEQPRLLDVADALFVRCLRYFLPLNSRRDTYVSAV